MNRVMAVQVKNRLILWKLLFFVVAIVIQTSFLAKCPLFLLRQVGPPRLLPQFCPEDNHTEATFEDKFIFTMIVFMLLFIGSFIESLVLEIHVYKFLFKQSTVDVREFKNLCIEGLTRKKWITVSFVILAVFYTFVHSLLVPSLGIALEVKHGKSSCDEYIYEYHMIYWFLDVIYHFYGVTVRLFMLLATMAIGVIWSKDDTARENVSDARTAQPKTYMEYLEDRKVASIDHMMRTDEYTNKGRMVEPILEMFQAWFIIPWVLYFIGSSLDTEHILKSWRDKPTGDGQYNFSEVLYMVYNFSQLLLLTLAYLTSKKMNTHHQNYFSKSRRQQIQKHKSASRMALASMNKIEEEDHFNFTPRIWGTSIKINIENPLYIMLLLVSIFFTVIEAFV